MIRNLNALAGRVHDLLVVGGGIYGACVAWEAVLRGLSVALVEKADFGSATSSNTLKIIHGGFRYLQHADFRRMRESIRERRTLMRIAPHLVRPLPVLIPAYGHWTRGKEMLAAALMINDVISFDRNRGIEDACQQIPRGRVLTRNKIVRVLPGIERQNLTGGILFYDAQACNTERLLLAFLRSAAEAGAVLANYAEVIRFLKARDGVLGVETKDVLTEDRLEIRARAVVNACGPWGSHLVSLANGQLRPPRTSFAKAMNIVTRSIFPGSAVGIANKNDVGGKFSKGDRFLFIVPWRGRSLIGTSYTMYRANPDDLRTGPKEVESFLGQINRACPSAALKMDDVSLVHTGLLPASRTYGQNDQVNLSNRYEIRDHRRDGVPGLITVTGVKYTTARHVAERVIEGVFELRRQKPPKSLSSVTPLYGGRIDRFRDYLRAEIAKQPYGLGEAAVNRLVCNYGSAFPEVLRHGLDKTGSGLQDADAVLKAEVLYGIREEMAQTLSDIMFRRTDFGTAGYPGEEIVTKCARVMSSALGWSAARTERETEKVRSIFDPVNRYGNDRSKLASSAVQQICTEAEKV